MGDRWIMDEWISEYMTNGGWMNDGWMDGWTQVALMIQTVGGLADLQ